MRGPIDLCVARQRAQGVIAGRAARFSLSKKSQVRPSWVAKFESATGSEVEPEVRRRRPTARRRFTSGESTGKGVE